jgi:ADP-heptose:LPS heptosyltransferase
VRAGKLRGGRAGAVEKSALFRLAASLYDPVRILAIQLKRIGDFVLTAPALRALKTSSPAVELSLVHPESIAPLLPALARSVDRSLVYRTRGGNASLWQTLFAGSFDICVDFTGRDRSALMSLTSRAARRVVARSALRGSLWRRFCYNAAADIPVRSRHTVDFYLEHAAAALGRPVGDLTEALDAPILELPANALERAQSLLAAAGIAPKTEFIAIHPGSARPEKYWVAQRWAEVIDFCQGTLGRPCVLTGGSSDSAEQAHLARIRAALRQPCADLSGRLDLLTLAAVLSKAALFAGVDSGPMHLAATFRRPQVVLFGPTNPFHWRPRHAACAVLQAGMGDSPVREFQERSPRGDLQAISTQAVISCISKLLPVP